MYAVGMNVKEYIKLCCVKRNISGAELARRSGQSSQNLNNKMQANNFKVSELEKLAAALDARLEIRFVDAATNTPLF